MAEKRHKIVYSVENKYLFINEIKVKKVNNAIVIVLQCIITKAISATDFIGVVKKSVVVQDKEIYRAHIITCPIHFIIFDELDIEIYCIINILTICFCFPSADTQCAKYTPVATRSPILLHPSHVATPPLDMVSYIRLPFISVIVTLVSATNPVIVIIPVYSGRTGFGYALTFLNLTPPSIASD